MIEWTKLSSVKWLDAWEERFHGNANHVIEILKGGKSIRVKVYCSTKKDADNIVKQFGGSTRIVKDQEWMKPAATPPPLKIRDQFLVTSSSDAAYLTKLQNSNKKRQIISIPAELAFGTGDHATTSTCMRFLCDVAKTHKQNWTCADLGTGTGLLAIAAKKLGAGDTYACDFDPFSVKVTQENILRNHVSDIEVAERDVLKWKPKKKYDVVLANLFSTVLIEAFPVLAKLVKPGGDLIISGILAAQAWDVITAGTEQGFGFPTVIKKGKWVTAHGKWMNELTEE